MSELLLIDDTRTGNEVLIMLEKEHKIDENTIKTLSYPKKNQLIYKRPQQKWGWGTDPPANVAPLVLVSMAHDENQILILSSR